MGIFICPNCEKRSELENENEGLVSRHVCPHCGEEFNIDHESNVIVED